MTKHFVAYRLVIDYSLIIGNNQWLINWLPIDYLLITHWFHWCHRLVMSGLIQQERSLSTWSLFQWTVKGTQLCLVSASLCNGRHIKRKRKGRLALWKCNELDSIHVLSHPQSLFSNFPSKCLIWHRLCVVWFRDNCPMY